jgi:predicted methyltransferase
MKTHLHLAIASLVLAGAACKKEDRAAGAPAAEDPRAAARADGPVSPDEEARRQEAQRAAEALAKARADDEVERARWTPELTQAAAALRDRDFKDTRRALEAILASEHRAPGHRERDAHRRPLETLAFFGIEPTMTVVEVGAGGGWYTELLAPLLARRGKLIVVSFDPDGSPEVMTTVYGQRLAMFLARSPELYGAVQFAIIEPPDLITFGPDDSADLALAFREMHGWQRRGQMDAYLAAVHRVLKDGGTFGVVQHRAADDARPEESAEQGYLPQPWLIERVEAAGFELAGASEINANPKDTKDYPKGVWTLPPNLREGETDRDRYLAIGESDRMTLKFVKRAR